MKRLAALALLVIPSLALAQPAPPQRVEGTVSALTDTSMTIKKADGTSETVALLPTRNVNITAPIAVDQIQPGSYVATANKTQTDGSGVSTELRVYPATTGRVNVNRAMNADGDLMMTNGTVATAVSSDGGRVLTVDYGQGQRKITVPKTITVVSNTQGTASQVKVGVKLSIVTFAGQGGGPGGQIITIDKKDLPAQ
jgi:ribosomal protein L2